MRYGDKFMAKWSWTDKEIEDDYAAATEAGRIADVTEPRAKAVRYDPESRRVVIDLRNNTTFIFPIDQVQGLRGASDEELAQIVIRPHGESLHWPRLDWDCGIPNLIMGIFGSHTWMKALRAEIGRRGGSKISEAKARAARENGKKGGRPKKRARP